MNEYLDSLFKGFSADSLPIRDSFEKIFRAKSLAVPVENLPAKIQLASERFNCPPEIFLMGAYGLLLARFAGADEVLFAAESDKKIPVALNFSSEQNISDVIKNLRDQVERSREVIETPYEKIAEAYGFQSVPEFVSAARELNDRIFALHFDEKTCAISIHFDGGRYSEALAESFAAAYANALAQLPETEKVGDLNWLSADELEKIQRLHDTGWEVAERPAYRLLQDSAEKFPDRVAAIANGQQLTYAELNRAANRVGHILRNSGVGVEQVVALVLNRGLEVYIAREGILKAGGAFLAMTPDYPDERIKFIVQDAKVRNLITTRDIYSERKKFFDALNISICLIEEMQSTQIPAENLNVEVPSGALAYCIYTSGSTGKPKGVMLTNHNLVNFVDANPKNHEILGYTERGKISLALAAITFDVSIMEEFIPLAHGLTICMANENEIYNPMMLKELCDKNQVDLMSCTPSYLANLIDFPEFESVVKRVKSVDFGAEAFPGALFTKLRAINPKIYIMNGYGPTEATVSCTMKAIESAENITIGFPNSNVKVVMTDEKNRPLPVGALGEMTIIGDGIGRGYVNRDDLTQKVFISLWGKPAYKSGDLARLLPNGEIAFHGRTDNQVKLRGLRVELGEIETVLNGFDGVKSSIVVVKKNSAGDYLAGYFTAEKPIDLDALRKHLAASLTAYMVPGVLMQLEKFPLTASRKIDKKALPEPEEITQSAVENLPPQNEVQQKIFDCVAEVLGTKDFGVRTELLSAGLTSIGMIRLNVILSTAFGKVIRTRDIVENSTIEQLEKFLSMAENLQTYAEQKDYPLSRTQQDIFVEYDAAPEETTFNLPLLLPLPPAIDLTRLKRAVEAAIDAHPYLKAAIFLNEAGEIRVRRQDDLPAKVELKAVEKLPAAAELVRPFALTKEPLYRATIYETPAGNYLFMDFHHIVYDGSSEEILFDDLNAAYDGKILRAETYTGFEAALDEETARNSAALAESKNYYDALLRECEVEVLPAVDFPENVSAKSPVVEFERYRTKLSADRVKNFCAENSCTFNAFFLAVFGYFLARKNQRADASFTTIYHGRNDSRLSNSVGMFVKTLPMLVDAEKFDTVKTYVDSVGQQLVANMAHDLYSFAEISAAYGFKGELMCVYQGENFTRYSLGGETVTSIPLVPSAAMSNLCLEIFLEDGAFDFRFEYRPNVYKAETVKNFAVECEEIAEKFLTDAALEKFEIAHGVRAETKKIAAVDHTAPQNETQRKIFDCIAEIVGTKNFGIRTDVRTIGLTSIGMIRLNVLLARAFGKNIRTNDIRTHGTVEQLEKFLANAEVAQAHEIQRAYPLTQTQNGIFVECVANLNTTIYNIPSFYRLDKSVDAARLQTALKATIDAHPYLKMILSMDNAGEIRAQRNDAAEAIVGLHYLEKIPPASELVKPFELFNKPLYRADIYVCGDEKFLFTDFHHIICDGESIAILMDDLNAAYGGKILRAETYTGFEFALDEEKARASESFARAKEYYETIFSGCDANCRLAKDSDAKSTAAVAYEFSRLEVDVNAVREFCAKNNVTLNGFFNAAFGFTLAKFLHRDNAIFTTIYNGRSDSRLAGSVAMLVKTLPVSCAIGGEKTVVGYVQETGGQLLESMANDIYSFAEISREFGITADVMFAYQNETEAMKIAGADAEEISLELDKAKSLFSMDIFMEGGEFCFDVEYRPDFYTSATVRNFAAELAKVAREFLTKENLAEVCRSENPPAESLRQTLCEIFAKALGRDSVGADENFFELGGTSLAASKVSMAAYLKKLPVVYADIFKYPTAEKLEAFILSKNPAPVVEQKSSSQVDFSEDFFMNELFKIEHVLAKNRVEYVDEICHGDLGDVLLTGATGFLGIHVLHELLKNTSAKIFCFSRRGKAISAAERLKNIFIYYFNSALEKVFDERVTVIDGDITSGGAVNELAKYPFKTVVNCAACVKHFAASDILTRVNVEGVHNLINLCVKKNARLIQISTVSVAGDNVDSKIPADRKLAEKDFYIGQEVISNKYVYSKFLAEELVLSAVGRGVLDAKIMRVGNLMSRISDGEFQINFMTNAFMRDLRSYAVIGKFPVSLMDEVTEFSPIDETAHMIIELADTNAEFTVFHVVNSHRVQMGDVISAMNDYGIKIDVVSDENFNAALTAAMRDEKKNLFVSNLIAYAENGSLDTLEVDHDDSFTIKALYRLNCRWKITDENYIHNAIHALDTLGFFEGTGKI